jgi:FkbM family methyltransferase
VSGRSRSSSDEGDADQAPAAGAREARKARTVFFDGAAPDVSHLSVRIEGATFVVTTSDRRSERFLFAKEDHPELGALSRAVRIVRHLLGDDAIRERSFVDASAGIGTAAIPALVTHGFGTAICCEPSEGAFRRLGANIALNGLGVRIRALRVAVSSSSGAMPVRPEERNEKSSALPAGAEDDTLDRLCRSGVIEQDRVGMVWIKERSPDVDAGRILSGAAALVERGIPLIITLQAERVAAEADSRSRSRSIHEALRSYTHVVDLRRTRAEHGRPRIELRPVGDLREIEASLWDASDASSSTHLLLLRLDAKQVPATTDLDPVARRPRVEPPKEVSASAAAHPSLAAGGLSERRREQVLAEQIEHACRIRAEHLVDASQPLVLISQMQRSGGTLLNQLFDGHPQLHVYPPEMKLGGGREWPVLDMTAGPEAWWRALQDPETRRALARGYRKDRVDAKLGHVGQLESFPFLFAASLQERLFHALAAERRPEQPRDVLDCYMTSYFNAWIDNQNLYGGPKRWIVGFRGKLSASGNLDAFFRDYPDGRHVTCVRDPVARTASKLTYRQGGDVYAYVDAWCRRTTLQLEAKERYGARVFLVLFERLVTDTAAVARALASWLGILFDPILAEPTFNRFPIKANSSFAVQGTGIRLESREHWRAVIDEAGAAEIRRRTQEIHSRAKSLADPIEPAGPPEP